MTVNTILLVIAGLVPAVVLCFYVFSKDKVEKEPLPLLLKLLLLGAISCLPAAYLETAIISVIDGIFKNLTMTPILDRIYKAVYYFIGVALVEEGLKWLILYYVTKNNKEFNCIFDGMIYAIFVSLGFAAFENVLYVMEYGWINAVMRAILSVPGHMFFAVMMGWYYSLWHITELASVKERDLQFAGVLPACVKPFEYTEFVALSIIVPILFHGFYNYCCSGGTILSTLVLYVFVIFMYRYCFGKIRKMSSKDTYNLTYVDALLISKYPELQDNEISEYTETI